VGQLLRHAERDCAALAGGSHSFNDAEWPAANAAMKKTGL
jgi:hypothetical protein